MHGSNTPTPALAVHSKHRSEQCVESDEMNTPDWVQEFRRPSFWLGLLASLGGAGLIALTALNTYNHDQTAVYDTIRKTQDDFHEDLGKTLAAISKVQNETSVTHDRLMEDEAASNARVAQYAPKLEATIRAQDIQDTRIQNLAQSVVSLRDSVTDLAKVAGQTHEDLAVIKSHLDYVRAPTGPHGG